MKHSTTLSPHLDHGLDMVKAAGCKNEDEKDEDVEGNDNEDDENDENERDEDYECLPCDIAPEFMKQPESPTAEEWRTHQK